MSLQMYLHQSLLQICQTDHLCAVAYNTSQICCYQTHFTTYKCTTCRIAFAAGVQPRTPLGAYRPL